MQVPDGYKPLLDKVSKSLNQEDLQLLNDIVNKRVVPSKDQVKKLGLKMMSGLNKWEKLKFTKMLLFLSINK